MLKMFTKGTLKRKDVAARQQCSDRLQCLSAAPKTPRDKKKEEYQPTYQQPEPWIKKVR